MKLERWQTFSKRDQLLHIGAAILRAASFQKEDHEKFSISLREAQALTLLTLDDPRWNEHRDSLLGFSEELQKFSRNERRDSIKILYEAL